MWRWTAAVSRHFARRAKMAGDWPGAARHYGRAVAADPGHGGTWVQYGNALRRQGRRDEAVAAYRRGLAHDPTSLEINRELIALCCADHLRWPPPDRRRYPGGLSPIVIDASDLLRHFFDTRLLTGIQRVQLQVVAALLADGDGDAAPPVLCYAAARELWVWVPPELFLRLAHLSLQSADTGAVEWRDAVLALGAMLVHAEPFDFACGTALVNLGAAWSAPNYLVSIRHAKASRGIRYIPFVHDCIPLVTPQFCLPETVEDYVAWLTAAFVHADDFIVNSQSTADDLVRVAGQFGRTIPPPHVVRLDGPFSPTAENGAARPAATLPAELAAEDFVLFVATFEPRKNHLLAFEAWLTLIGKRGSRRTPTLVCVGHRGWMFEPATALLRSSRALRRRVRLLTGISDADLAELYRQCLFTLYPSFYEGWGLPVTESLCYGKVALVSRTASLPEAGGEFAEYFDLRSKTDLLEKLERLIDDRAYRTAREDKIRADFRARGWREIGEQVMARARQGRPACRGTSPRDASASG